MHLPEDDFDSSSGKSAYTYDLPNTWNYDLPNAMKKTNDKLYKKSDPRIFEGKNQSYNEEDDPSNYKYSSDDITY